MRLSRMRYKGFLWPHNPRVYSIEFERKMAVNKVPFGQYALQNLGLTRRVMKGEGEFVGGDAYTNFKALATVFYEETPGILVHPLWDTASAWFVGLELEQEPRPDYVRYRFEFWEEHAATATSVQLLGVPEKEIGAVIKADQGLEDGREESSAKGAEATWHTVVQGETLWGIAVRYGVELTALIALNPQIKNPNLINVGQKVRVA